MKKLIVDGNNIACASYFVAERNNEIEKTPSIFYSIITKLENDFEGKAFIAWDGKGGSTWRKSILPEYKGNRDKEGKEDLFEQLGKCREIDLFSNFCYDEFEGDDVVYALCKVLDGEKIIVSSDKDFIQVVQEGLADSLYSHTAKKFREIPRICNIIEKAIAGDRSDNLLGIRNRGPAFVKKFVKRQARLTMQEWDIYQKHRLVVGLKYHPRAEELAKMVLEDLGKVD